MLDPINLPEELREIEADLSREPSAEISQELHAKVMSSVHETIDRERHAAASRRSKTRHLWLPLSMVSLATAACVALIVARFIDQKPNRWRLSHLDPAPVAQQYANEDESGADDANEDNAGEDLFQDDSSLPTIQHYRLALSESPADWEALVDRELDMFQELGGDSQPIRWRQGTSSLQDD